jgi:hypothetical protein
MGQRCIETGWIMKIVKLAYHANNQRLAAMWAIELSNWCKEQGLVHGRDYDWAFMNTIKEIHFRFYSDSESMSTMFTLRWAGHEV